MSDKITGEMLADRAAELLLQGKKVAPDGLRLLAKHYDTIRAQLSEARAAKKEMEKAIKDAFADLGRANSQLSEAQARLVGIGRQEPVAWAITYDGVTPYRLADWGDGPLLDAEVSRQGGSCAKMPLYAAPVSPAAQVAQVVADDALHHLRLLRDDCVTPVGVVGAVVINGYRLKKVREALDAMLATQQQSGGAE